MSWPLKLKACPALRQSARAIPGSAVMLRNLASVDPACAAAPATAVRRPCPADFSSRRQSSPGHRRGPVAGYGSAPPRPATLRHHLNLAGALQGEHAEEGIGNAAESSKQAVVGQDHKVLIAQIRLQARLLVMVQRHAFIAVIGQDRKSTRL